MNKLLNIMRMHAQSGDHRACTRLATVSGYDPSNYAAKVIFQPDGTESGWLPIFSPWIGNGWGLFCPPTIGDMVQVEFQEGSHEAGIICLRGFNDIDRPLPVTGGEFWLVHKTGSFLKFHNDGSVEVNATAGLNATVGGTLTATVGGAVNLSASGAVTASAASWSLTGNLTVTGNVVASGNISDQGGSKNTLQHVRDNYNSHTHAGVQSGSSNTATPSAPL